MTTHFEASRRRYEELQAELAEKRLIESQIRRQPHKRRPGKRGYAKTLRYRHGLSITQYMAQVRSQDGKCLLCGQSPDHLVVDHDHKTHALRALLCARCNSALGMLQDSPELLRLAAEYIEYYKAIPS